MNEQKAEQEKREKYNPNDLFKNKKTNIDVSEDYENNVEEKDLIEYKQHFFTRFKNFILKILNLDS